CVSVIQANPPGLRDTAYRGRCEFELLPTVLLPIGHDRRRAGHRVGRHAADGGRRPGAGHQEAALRANLGEPVVASLNPADDAQMRTPHLDVSELAVEHFLLLGYGRWTRGEALM